MKTDEIIVGIDEVGRGCWAGPLVVAAVSIAADDLSPEIKDSKLLTKRARSLVAVSIKNKAIYCRTGWVWPEEIDKLGLTAATKLAIDRAIKDIKAYDKIIIDGSVNFLADNPKAVCIIKADASVAAVSAASIVAKCERDKYMLEQSNIYPQYGFERHVGYGTSRHKRALANYGVTLLHRASFKPIKNMKLQFHSVV